MLTPLHLMTIYFKLVMLDRYFPILCTLKSKIADMLMSAILNLIIEFFSRISLPEAAHFTRYSHIEVNNIMAASQPLWICIDIF